MRIAKTLVSTLAIAGLIVAVGCADAAVKESGVDHKVKSTPADATTTTTPAPEGSAAATTTTTSAPAPAPSAPATK